MCFCHWDLDLGSHVRASALRPPPKVTPSWELWGLLFGALGGYLGEGLLTQSHLEGSILTC